MSFGYLPLSSLCVQVVRRRSLHPRERGRGQELAGVRVREELPLLEAEDAEQLQKKVLSNCTVTLKL